MEALLDPCSVFPAMTCQRRATDWCRCAWTSVAIWCGRLTLMWITLKHSARTAQ